MRAKMEEAVRAVTEAGNGSRAVIPLAGGGAIQVTYLWRKVGVEFLDKEGKITEPDRRVGGSRISLDAETEMGEGGARRRPPVQLALSDEFLPLPGDNYDDTD